MIRAVTIDLWGTLFLDGPVADEDYRRPRLAGLKSRLSSLGIPMSMLDLDQAYTEATRRLERLWQSHRDIAVRAHVSNILEALHPSLPARLSEDALTNLVEVYSSPAQMVPPAFDHAAKAVVDALAARDLVLCMVSNIMRTPGVVLRRLLDRQGLLEQFRVLTFSDECGIRKPDPEIFRLTLRAIGIAPEEAVHVGDSPVLDVKGAHDAGMRAIQLSARGGSKGDPRADAVIANLGELPDAVGALDP
jgi:HAD superfamily hydrolase (TIGR01509 family)